MKRDRDYELENGLALFGSDEELATQIPTQAQSLVEGSGSIRIAEFKPVPDVDYLQVCNSTYYCPFDLLKFMKLDRTNIYFWHHKLNRWVHDKNSNSCYSEKKIIGQLFVPYKAFKRCKYSTSLLFLNHYLLDATTLSCHDFEFTLSTS